MEYFFSGALLRMTQIVVDASIWIAFGCFISSVFRYMIGSEKTRSIFGNEGRFGLLIGWAVGMLLPVCSLGVIPVVRELHRSGVKPGTIVAFGLTAPLFNPLSVLYGLSLPDPMAIIIFSAAAMMIVTVMGAIWGRGFSANESATDPGKMEALPAIGIKRALAVVYGAAKEFTGWSFLFILIGVVCSALLAATVPHGSLQGETEPDKKFAPVVMSAYIAPVYSTPLLAMSQIGGMFQHGNSIGAAFALLILGAGINLGVVSWFASAFGVRRVLLFVGCLFAITIAIAYSLDKPLYPKGVTPSGHTHAFDIYTHPYPDTKDEVFDKAVKEVKEYHDRHAFGGTQLMLFLGVLGLLIRAVELRWDLYGWFQRGRDNQKRRMDVILPGWVIGVVACVGLVTTSLIGTYVYYPSKHQLLDDLTIINADCVSAAKSGDWEGVKKWVPYCDDLSRRLEVGTLLREGSVSEFRRAKASVYRKLLDKLRDDIEVGQTENVGELSSELHRSFLQLRTAFRND